MKKYTYSTKPTQGGPSFLPPWGAMGCLWRTLLFLLALAALILLLSFFRSCESGAGGNDDPGWSNDLLPDSQPIDLPVDSIIDIPDNAPIPGQDDPLPDNNIPDPGPNLPEPDDNYIPPVNDDEIVQDPDTGRQMVDDRINVILDSGADDETFKRWAEEFKQLYPGEDYKILFYDPYTKLIQVQVPPGSCDRMVRELPQKITDIKFKAFREGIMGGLTGAVTPNDPAFNDTDASWYFSKVQAQEAWEITMGSPEITVAIVDSYFDLRHPELYSDRIVAPFNIHTREREVGPVAGLPENQPPYFHGSCVSSMALATANNGNGACGIAPNCKYMPIAMGHQFTLMTMMYGILYAIYQGANVINVSAGLNLPEEIQDMPIEEQIEIATAAFLDEQEVWEYVYSLADARNVTIVWAAGNNNIVSAIDPSKRGDNTIRVSAVDRRLRKASFSNFGDMPGYDMMCSTISAPGVDILGAVPGNRYTLGPGTSYSAPIVTGAVALMKSLDPTLTNEEIITILRETGKPIEGCNTLGPLLQIRDALLRVKNNMASADDILRDHSKIIGSWQTTEMSKVYKIATGEWTGEYKHIYLTFTSETSGTIAYYIKERSEPCNMSPVTVTWTDDSFTVTHTNNAGTFVPASYVFKKGTSGDLLECLQISQNNQPFHAVDKYYLKKVDETPCGH